MQNFQSLSEDLARLTEQAGRYVVAVHARPRMFSSGIHWQKGVIVTAEHTVRQDEDISVTLPSGNTVTATLVGRDAGSDLAVLRLDDKDAAFDTAVPADAPTLRAGQLVLAVARSREDGMGASLGVISCVSDAWRTWRGGQIDSFVQPDVTLYPGFSGGALVTAGGNCVGLNTSALARRMAITVPPATIADRVRQLLERGHISRAYLGVGMHPVRLAEASAIVVLSVEAAGPAERAGLLVGDVLLSLDGKPTGDTEEVVAYLTATQPGHVATASLLRGGQPHTVPVTLGERPR